MLVLLNNLVCTDQEENRVNVKNMRRAAEIFAIGITHWGHKVLKQSLVLPSRITPTNITGRSILIKPKFIYRILLVPFNLKFYTKLFFKIALIRIYSMESLITESLIYKYKIKSYGSSDKIES